MNIIKYSREIKRIEEFMALFTGYYLYEVFKKPNLDQLLELKNRRENLNSLSDEVKEYIRKVDISTSISPTKFSSEALGIDEHIDLFKNLFDFNETSYPQILATDILERGIGKYRFLQKKFLKQLCNPIIWIREIIRIPFHLISFAGWNGDRVEVSIFGKLWKLIVSFSGLIKALDFLLKIFNYELIKTLKSYLPDL